jgi:DNA topoisomerase-1
VNEYLHAITGEEITAKDFRTWAATSLAALALRELEEFDSQAKAKRNMLRAVEAVSQMLHNTPAICRKCYIHPAIFDGYLDGSLRKAVALRAQEKLADPGTGLRAEEAAVLGFLANRLEQTASPDPRLHKHQVRRVAESRQRKPHSRPVATVEKNAVHSAT